MASFSWFGEWDGLFEIIPSDGDKDTLKLALVNYGMTGEAKELPYPLNGFFFLMMRDIDNSINARKQGAKGGSKTKQKTPSKTKQRGVDNPPSEPPLPSGEGKPIQNSTVQNSTVQDSDSARKRAKHPTTDEVREFANSYASEKGLAPIDAERFVDYYAAQGWKLSNGQPLKDWKAAVRNWTRNSTPKTEEVLSDDFNEYL